jgi:hypothetical protein
MKDSELRTGQISILQKLLRQSGVKGLTPKDKVWDQNSDIDTTRNRKELSNI